MSPESGSEILDPEEILNDSLETLYDYQPITLTSSGSIFTYSVSLSLSSTVTLRTPDTEASNWSLHVGSIWASSLYLTDNIKYLHLDSYLTQHRKENEKIRLLELGAGAGLPGIVIAKSYPEILVTVSDYPDDKLIHALSENIKINQVSANCFARAYAWGSDPQDLLRNSSDQHSDLIPSLFSIIIAADTLWNSDLHGIFIDSLKKTRSLHFAVLFGCIAAFRVYVRCVGGEGSRRDIEKRMGRDTGRAGR
ncbi:hypothetical protein GYMLUDRAFT_51107 [Collybiopsis luxurians FD-317 M1]|uniref:Protein N-terminal and lysine N-methyltransferase EFM7 n=1 Tax=Collybiopsis luxurians FD-317 M1 TaxID=944289 RepID=A0A0D0B8V9_9AGAR|nr:hypothetical protein GYMLUDRAFT_51107 [Collybiopsis luxurians FD-317 M1]